MKMAIAPLLESLLVEFDHRPMGHMVLHDMRQRINRWCIERVDYAGFPSIDYDIKFSADATVSVNPNNLFTAILMQDGIAEFAALASSDITVNGIRYVLENGQIWMNRNG